MESSDLSRHNADLYDRMADNADENDDPRADYYRDKADSYRDQITDDDEEEETAPIIMDLDGNGVTITERSKSSIYLDGRDGKQHRTAWAGDLGLGHDAGGDA